MSLWTPSKMELESFQNLLKYLQNTQPPGRTFAHVLMILRVFALLPLCSHIHSLGMEWLLVLRMKGNKELKWICWEWGLETQKRGIHVFLQVFSKCQWWFGENDTGAEGNLLLWSLLQQTMEASYLVRWYLPHTILREHTLVILIGKGGYSSLLINFANQPLQCVFCFQSFNRNLVPSNPYCSFGFGMHYNMKKHKRTEGRKKESAINP